MSGNQQSDQEPTGLTINQAARALNVSENAVRQRIKRGTLPAEKIDGIWRVDIDDQDANHEPDHETGQPTATTSAISDQSAYVEHLETEVSRLWAELESRRLELERRDVIIARLTERIPALESGATGSSETATDTDDDQHAMPADTDSQDAESGAWWYFWRR